MGRFGFVGPSYASQSIIADNQRCLNWNLEADESGQGKSAMVMYRKPGTARFSTLPDAPVRGGCEINGRTFRVSGATFFEIFADGTFKAWGAVLNDGKRASVVASNVQVMIAAGQQGFCFTLATNTFTPIDNVNTLPRPVLVQYADGFFVALRADGKFQYSSPLDGTTWPGTSTSAISVFPETALALLMDHRDIFIFGQKRSVAYYDSGNIFTFDVNPSGFIEDGIAGAFCCDRIDNGVMYLSVNERGNIQAKRLSGYTPTRISNFAVETKWRSYATVSDCVSYAYGFDGHEIWRLYFPSANPIPGTNPVEFYGATWDYDAASQMWTEACFMDPATGAEWAHRSWGHTNSFGKHLVDDWKTGNIYQMDDAFFTDDGNLIKRQRRAPHISTEQERVFHSFLQLDMEVGMGPQPPLLDAAGNPRGPQVMLRWSNNGGKTYGNEHWADCGQAGQFDTRVIWRRLGYARDRVYELNFTDPAECRIIDAYLEATGYDRPTPRLTKKYTQVA